MTVFLGVDPHKRLHAVVTVDHNHRVLARATFPNTCDGFAELHRFSRRWKDRTLAIEGCNGVGKHLSQRLFSTGERVVDVSTRRAALVRVFAGGNGRKNDDTDAHSIAMVAAHTPDLPEVRADDRSVALRLVSHRRKELVGLLTQTVCRIHRDLQVLIPGGAARKLSATRAKELFASVRPRDEVGKLRRRFIADQIRDLERIDRQIAKLDQELADMVDDTPTNLRDLYGVGTITTALILGEVGDAARFRDRHHFASYTGTPQPTEAPPATRGHRSTRTATVASTTPSTSSPSPRSATTHRPGGSTPCKISEGKTKKEALRVVKRRVADAVLRQLVADARQNEQGGRDGKWGRLYHPAWSAQPGQLTLRIGHNPGPQPSLRPFPTPCALN